MAKIGLKYPVYSPATESAGAITYGTGAVLAKAISANISIENNDVKLYADDAVAESDNSFASGTVTIGIDDLYDTAKVALLDYIEGDTIDDTTGAKELSVGTASPAYVGFGFYGKAIRDKVPYWRAIWLKKVQFAEPSDELQTKGENVEFRTPTLEGTIMMAADGKWKEEATFSTEAGAKTWLDGKCGLAKKCAPVVSSVASGTYTDAQSVVLTCATDSAVIKYTIDGTIPSATHGSTYSAPIACAAGSNTCIKAVATKDTFANSDILELYIIVEQ
jgi:phi13 family phage major tail protein